MAVQFPRVTVKAIVDAPGPQGASFTLLAGAAGLSRPITSAVIQKTGLALAGFERYLHAGRPLILAESEMNYLAIMPAGERRARLAKVFAHELPCVVVTDGLDTPVELVEEAERAGVPALSTPLGAAAAMARLTALLEDALAPRDLVHGVLLDILGLGVLLVGESGIGKSECALDLVVRGHRLVADDAIEARRREEGVVIGSCPELTRDHIEVRGIGIMNVTDLFGVSATRHSKRIEYVVQLDRWVPGQEYERLGLDDKFCDVLGVPIPMVRIPVAPGRNVAILVEVAARNQLLRTRGLHPAQRLADELDATLRQRSQRNQEAQ